MSSRGQKKFYVSVSYVFIAVDSVHYKSIYSRTMFHAVTIQ